MILFKKGAEMASWARQQRAAGRQIGFVPTMGALHEGHISLIGMSKNALPLTVCSIFVNPTQFNDPRDFQKYPVTIENDIYMLEQAGADVLFLPEVTEIYPGGMDNLETYDLGRLEVLWEGKFRPGHFQGVCQVVRRLLENVEPDRLFMGQKDYQQCMVIRRLLKLMGSNILLDTCPIMRESDGLAMSSRNQRLSPAERQQAPVIYQALIDLKELWKRGGQKGGRQGIPVEALASGAAAKLTRHGLRPDYISIADAETLEPLQDGQATNGQPIALAAAWLGEVRLIDNLLLNNS